MPTLNIGIFAIYICIWLCNFKLIDKPAHLIVRFLFRFVKSICLNQQKICQKYLSNSTTISTNTAMLSSPASSGEMAILAEKQESPLSSPLLPYAATYIFAFFLTSKHLQRHCLFLKQGSLRPSAAGPLPSQYL